MSPIMKFTYYIYLFLNYTMQFEYEITENFDHLMPMQVQPPTITC